MLNRGFTVVVSFRCRCSSLKVLPPKSTHQLLGHIKFFSCFPSAKTFKSDGRAIFILFFILLLCHGSLVEVIRRLFVCFMRRLNFSEEVYSSGPRVDILVGIFQYYVFLVRRIGDRQFVFGICGRCVQVDQDYARVREIDLGNIAQ